MTVMITWCTTAEDSIFILAVNVCSLTADGQNTTHVLDLALSIKLNSQQRKFMYHMDLLTVIPIHYKMSFLFTFSGSV
jgi:hypothetical protein